MSSIKKLASQTIWYGLPTILTRFIGFTLNIIVIQLYPPQITNDMQLIYNIIPVLMIIFTYGLETSYFRFSLNHDQVKLFNTSFTSIIISSFLLSLMIFILADPISNVIGLNNQGIMVRWMALILLFDTLSAIPFAKLRQQERPKKYAFVKMTSVIVQFLLLLLVYKLWIPYIKANQNSGFGVSMYNGNDMLYFIIINVLTSFLSFILLFFEWKDFTFKIDINLIKKILQYSLPLVLIGILGMSNEVLGRVIFNKLLNYSDEEITKMSGILQGIAKIAILINVFTQMFRIAAEPFFFSKSKDKDAKNIYSQSMILYIILSIYAYISVVFFKEMLLKFVAGKFFEEYLSAIYIVPLLLWSLILSGMYYNLAVWYKLTDNNLKGLIIACFGLIVNIVLSILLVPKFSYGGMAVSSLISYILLTVVSYIWGQRHYKIDYNLPKIFAHIIFINIVYFILSPIQEASVNELFKFSIGIFAFILYTVFVLITEKTLIRNISNIRKKLT